MLDERSIMHRYKATRLAVLVGTIMMFAYFTYELVTTKVIRWDLFIILAAMAAVKLAARFYYARTN